MAGAPNFPEWHTFWRAIHCEGSAGWSPKQFLEPMRPLVSVIIARAKGH